MIDTITSFGVERSPNSDVGQFYIRNLTYQTDRPVDAGRLQRAATGALRWGRAGARRAEGDRGPGGEEGKLVTERCTEIALPNEYYNATSHCTLASGHEGPHIDGPRAWKAVTLKMNFVKDWATEAAEAINSVFDGRHLQNPVLTARTIILNHSPFKPDVVYMPVPRCDGCRHWKPQHVTSPLGDCSKIHTSERVQVGNSLAQIMVPLPTLPSFGCVMWEAR